jgi:hypothetical protein
MYYSGVPPFFGCKRMISRVSTSLPLPPLVFKRTIGGECSVGIGQSVTEVSVVRSTFTIWLEFGSSNLAGTVLWVVPESDVGSEERGSGSYEVRITVTLGNF